MKYKDKEISELTDVELGWAETYVNDRYDDTLEIRKSERYLKLFKNRAIPPINSVFLQLRNEVNNEIIKRKEKAN